MNTRLILLCLLSFAFTAEGFGQETLVPAVTSLHRLVTSKPEDLRELFLYSEESMPLVSAHRGGAGLGFPENCIATFEHTLSRTFAMLEVDPRMTKDGYVVLHHDSTLDRTTTGTGKLADYTLAELKQLRLKDTAGNVTNEQIPTLDEAIQWARRKAILVLDQKDVPLELRIRKVLEHDAESYVMLIVNSFQDAKACHEANGDLMMEVMMGDHKKVTQFDATGVPWSHVIAFVGHVPPTDRSLYQAIHDRGACCMIGTSRNLDTTFGALLETDRVNLRNQYLELFQRGVDVIETDLPCELAELLLRDQAVPPGKQRFFQAP